MINRNTQLNAWMWKWHVVAGLITLPFMLLLAITGTVYLFKENLNQQIYRDTLFVMPLKDNARPLSLMAQLSAAQDATDKSITAVKLPSTPEQATGFKLEGKGRSSKMVYVNPYTAEVTGQLDQKQTLMYLVRKLHGELLVDKPGTLVIELVASWFIVLILTGLYVWCPKKGSGVAGFFTVRTKSGQRLFWRDLHAVLGFWLSLFMLIILAGGMPWTDVFGAQLKWVQKQTGTGYPMHWRSHKGLKSEPPDAGGENQSLDLDEVADIARFVQLKGAITITIPTRPEGVYTLSNRAFLLENQEVLHVDQYSGKIIKALDWDDVGILMDLRQIFMRLHQGEYGIINWVVLLAVALMFTGTTAAGLISYLYRKPKGSWAIPRVPKQFNIGRVMIVPMLLLGVIFPMFGASLILLVLWEQISKPAT